MREINPAVRKTNSEINVLKPSFSQLGFSVDQIMVLNENISQVSFLMKILKEYYTGKGGS